ncbi:MAG: radical SAM protein [Clostridiales bacterium]|nr:radical SAM protein [Clostridiales bacterium]
MKAEIAPGYTQKRQRLADVLPLDAPFTLFVSPTQVCNFKCFYCTQCKSKEEKEKIGFKTKHLEFEVFKKIADDSTKFNGKIKRVLFTGLGEPLANPRLPEMIKYMKQLNIAQGYEIITNAYLLSHEMTDALLDAGLTFLRISIQGLTEKKYKEVAGVDIDYSKLIDNISYFYSKKGNCRLYIKIMDACFDEGESQEDFFKMFGDICDDIYIEHLIKAQPSMMDKYEKNVESVQTFYGDKAEAREVCPYAFYSLQIDAEGNTFPCPPLGFPEEFSFGNVKKENVFDIWNSNILNLQLSLLKEGRKAIKYCANCENYLCFTPKEDNLDNDRESLIKRFEEKRKCQK